VTATIIRGDARQLPLPDASVDLIVTSPPYFGLRSYTDGGEHYAGQIGAEATPQDYVAALLECTREWMRVLKAEGSLWVNLGDKYSQRVGQFGPQGQTGQRATRTQAASYADAPARRDPDYGVAPKSLLGLPWRYALGAIDDLGLILRAEVIWSKPNGLPESVTDRVRRSHEQWFHFVRQPRYFSAVDEIRETPQHPGRGMTPDARRVEGRLGDRAARGAREADRLFGDNSKAGHPLGKLPSSVWEIATQPLKVPAEIEVDHFAAFPMEWPRRLVAGWSPAGGVVLDPFGGTGTTALVADVLGRRGISVDRSADYCRLARWRTADPGERARALGVPKPPPVMDGQGDLFEEAAS
jgi:site-specific DNA-methyltransferase (cytosine-N4-specific)